MVKVETEWAHIWYNFTLLPHSVTLVSHRMYKKKRDKSLSLYREQSAASKLPFDGSHVTLISYNRTDCKFHFTAAIKFLPQSSRHATALSERGGGMGVVTSDTGRVYHRIRSIQNDQQAIRDSSVIFVAPYWSYRISCLKVQLAPLAQGADSEK